VTPPAGRGWAQELRFPVGHLPTGPLNAITDVPGVRVGHTTVWRDGEVTARTGATAVWPHDGNPFRERVYAATSVFNGYGIVTADIGMHEWGMLGAPIVLCDTANLGVAYQACVRYMSDLDPLVNTVDFEDQVTDQPARVLDITVDASRRQPYRMTASLGFTSHRAVDIKLGVAAAWLCRSRAPILLTEQD
jgi:D-aminopeptidase